MSEPYPTDAPRPFPETSWTMIRRVRDEPDDDARTGVLDSLCRRYWGPVFLYVLRYWTRGDRDEARDLTQDFFLAFLEKGFLESVDADRGRFRSFVCAALRHFLRDRKVAAHALKRRPAGGLVSLGQIDPEDPRLAAGESDDPEAAFDDDWRRATIDAALGAVRADALATDRGEVVDLFVEYYLSRSDGERPTYRDLCERSGLDYHRIKNGLAWVRARFSEALRAEIADQVATAEDLRAEARDLFGMELK